MCTVDTIPASRLTRAGAVWVWQGRKGLGKGSKRSGPEKLTVNGHKYHHKTKSRRGRKK